MFQDWSRTERGHGLTVDIARLLTDCGHRKFADRDNLRLHLRAGLGRGMAKAMSAGKSYCAEIPRPHRDHFADRKTLVY